MTHIRLLPKQQLRINNTVYEVVRRDGTGKWVLQDVQNLAPRTLSDEDVGTLFAEGTLSFVEPGQEVEEGFNSLIADYSQLPTNLREAARRSESYVRRVRERDLPHSATYLLPVIAEVAAEIEDPKPPSVSTVCRWLRRWKRSGERDIRALVPNHFGRGNRTRRLHYEVVAIIEDVVDDVYLRPERMTKRDAWDAAVAEVERLNATRPAAEALPVPSERAISKRIAANDRYEVKKAREGQQAADHEFRTIGACPRATRPLEVVEADHTKLDIILLSRDGIVLGRPWLTAVIDRFSRVPTGFHIGFDPPGDLSVANALRNSILPKGYVARDFPGVRNSWPCYGVPENIVVDNGTEFHGAWFDDACAQIGTLIHYAPVKSPWFKGKVERWLGTVARSFCHKLPGTTFSNVQQRGDYDSERRAAIDLDDFVHLFHKWLIDVFILEWHRGIKGIPRQLWEEGTREYPVCLPDRREDLDALLGGVEERTLGRQGIEMHGLLYASQEIRRLRTNPDVPRTVKVRFNPSNLEHVWVLDPTSGVSVQIPSVDPEYTTGLSLAQHNAAKRFAKEKSDGYITVTELCVARDELRRMAEEAMADGRRRTRARVARHLGMGTPAERAEQAIQDASRFMGDAPEALGGEGADTTSPQVGTNRRRQTSRPNADRAVAARASGEEPQAANSQWQDDDDDVIDPSALGITSVPRT